MMNKIILCALLLLSTLSYSADYREELEKYIVEPCKRHNIEKAGLDPNNPNVVRVYDELLRKNYEDLIEQLETLMILSGDKLTKQERLSLYQHGLKTCLGK